MPPEAISSRAAATPLSFTESPAKPTTIIWPAISRAIARKAGADRERIVAKVTVIARDLARRMNSGLGGSGYGVLARECGESRVGAHAATALIPAPQGEV